MKGKWLAGIFVVALVAAPSTSFAGDMPGARWTLSLTKHYTPSAWTSEVGYVNRAKAKLIFGAKNLVLGWTEIFTQPGDSMNEGDNVVLAVGKGLAHGIGQELGGAVHLVTFPITAIDVPLPEGGTQLL